MTGNAKIGAALVGGYLLGRTKKAKLAIGFGMFLAGKKLSFDPKQLAKLVANSPVLGSLNDQVRRELVDATKSAATNALTQRVSGLADSLHQRTLGLEDPDGTDARAEEDDEDDVDTGHDDSDDRDVRDEEEDEKPAPRRKPAAKASNKSASGGRRTASGATGGASKKTSSAARKSTSGARKTASSAGRKERGGNDG